jgi:hypothetical protein
MSNNNYTLEIISHHAKFASKSLRKYYVDGIETVGAWGDEPFEIRFKNNTWQKVQVKITLDGTDILTGKPADTEVSKDMWVVNGYATLSLKAWPETNNGGAQFVFTSADNSVAVHTHGDLSSRGIIAAAVFTEGHVEPIKISYPTYPIYETHNHYHYDSRCKGIGGGYYGSGGITYTGGNTGGLLGGSVILNNSTLSGASYNSISCNNASASAASSNCFNLSEGPADARGLESLVSVGAGQHVDQKISYVSGLIKPVFTETVRVRYLWWDDLQAKLRTQTVAQPHASGFPGDRERKNIDLKGTPRVGESKGVFRRVEQQQMFERV